MVDKCGLALTKNYTKKFSPEYVEDRANTKQQALQAFKKLIRLAVDLICPIYVICTKIYSLRKRS